MLNDSIVEKVRILCSLINFFSRATENDGKIHEPNYGINRDVGTTEELISSGLHGPEIFQVFF